MEEKGKSLLTNLMVVNLTRVKTPQFSLSFMSSVHYNMVKNNSSFGKFSFLKAKATACLGQMIIVIIM